MTLVTNGPRSSSRTSIPVTLDEAFLEFIIESPDDNAPRLIYADWLEENDQPERAEFIRVQCELAGLAEGDPRRRKLQARERTLLATHQEEWLGSLRGNVNGYEFRRGFVEAIVTSAGFFRDAKRLFAAAPIRVIRIRWGEAKAQDWAGCPYLTRLTGLELSSNGRFDRTNLLHVLSSPHLTGLKTLKLAGTSIGTRGVKDIVAWPHFTDLARLDLGCNHLDDAAADAMAQSLFIGHLGDLVLHRNRIGPAGAAALAAIASRGGLRVLDLDENPTLGDSGCQALAASLHEGSIALLSLDRTGIGDLGAQALAASPHLGHLRELSLRDNPIGDQGALALLASPHLAGLPRFRLSGTRLSDSIKAKIRGRFGAGACRS